MANIEITYLGDLRTELTHLQSGQKTVTDAPLDNHGKGEAISPTDMLAASLGSCMLTVMGLAARTHGIDIDGTDCSVTKVMAANPRRVAEITVSFMFHKSYTDKEQKILESASLTCPIYYSLSPDLKKTVEFGW
ncbi:OsmC family protein [Mucilaginibacter sp. SP1R1]|uniref:OsmC family protein n=1 Tax=Mucilaginibacter sp. SP1R1 TaxID=2723091 RepID=UPI001614DBC5|nr:OsmC family protein [Mucilaginibacter sp. SP1R1]MBB6150041.1 putative OsmC-like protein [Mucilaginibacter sp. SP1R1]